jgi:uncharacterized tellurite resistance protein B-like protein
VRKVFDEIEHELMSSIKHSDELRKFLESAEKLTSSIDDDVIDFIEDENQKMNESVDESKFASLIVRHKFYEKFDHCIQKMVANATADIESI